MQEWLVNKVQEAKRGRQEDEQSFWKRLRRRAAMTIQRLGKWSDIWRRRALSWHAHLQRHPSSWAAVLLRTEGEDWLRTRRAQYNTAGNSYTERAGRTRTRKVTGKVQKRWGAGIEDLLKKNLPRADAVHPSHGPKRRITENSVLRWPGPRADTADALVELASSDRTSPARDPAGVLATHRNGEPNV